MSPFGPTLPTLASRQVGSYLGYTSRHANVVATAAPDLSRTTRAHTPPEVCRSLSSCTTATKRSERGGRRLHGDRAAWVQLALFGSTPR